jgi:CubicO group peptidase (beta-lactamase class C family)
MTDYKIPSLAAGIIVNDSIIWAKNFGEQNESDTVFMIGSITKTFTAVAVLQLVERNLINLDDDINDYIPFNVRNPEFPMRNITVRMLLTHYSGIAPNLIWSLEYYLHKDMILWINNNLGWDITIWDSRPSLEEFLNGSFTPGGEFYDSYNYYIEPAIEFLYSNAGFQLLGYLVEQVVNQSLEEYIEENIFDPLNMTNTGYYFEEFIDKHATPYEWKNQTTIALPLYNINVTGAGSIKSSLPDMMKYLMAMMHQGEYNGIKILNTESVDLMHSRQVYTTGTSVEGFDYGGYGLGWFLYRGGFKGHGGATPGYSSHLYFKKTEDVPFGVILMFNRGTALLRDDILINEIIPILNSLILEEAEKLYNTYS